MEPLTIEMQYKAFQRAITRSNKLLINNIGEHRVQAINDSQPIDAHLLETINKFRAETLSKTVMEMFSNPMLMAAADLSSEDELEHIAGTAFLEGYIFRGILEKELQCLISETGIA